MDSHEKIFINTENATRTDHNEHREKWGFRGPVAEDVRQVLENRSVDRVEIYVDDTPFVIDPQSFRGYGFYKTRNVVFHGELLLMTSLVTDELIVVYKKFLSPIKTNV